MPRRNRSRNSRAEEVFSFRKFHPAFMLLLFFACDERKLSTIWRHIESNVTYKLTMESSQELMGSLEFRSMDNRPLLQTPNH